MRPLLFTYKNKHTRQNKFALQVLLAMTKTCFSYSVLCASFFCFPISRLFQLSPACEAKFKPLFYTLQPESNTYCRETNFRDFYRCRVDLCGPWKPTTPACYKEFISRGYPMCGCEGRRYTVNHASHFSYVFDSALPRRLQQTNFELYAQVIVFIVAFMLKTQFLRLL